jgi:hypothetical protein
MARTVLIADADDGARDRIARLAQQAGYRVLKARTCLEAAAALDGCPISGVIIDEGLLRRCDLGRLLLRAPVLVLSDDRAAVMAQDIALIPKRLSDEELKQAIIGLAGDPGYPGRRDVVSVPLSWASGFTG